MMDTINYMGSKKKLLAFLEKSFSLYEIDSFFDAFSGSTRVAYHFRDKYNVIVNDKLSFSKVIADALMLNKKPAKFYQPYIDELNVLKGEMGWFSKNYGGYENDGLAVVNDSPDRRAIWMMDNANRIDAIRNKIENYTELSIVERNVLLYCLIMAIKRVSNTLGHQNGYLRNWAKNCYKKLQLVTPNLESNNKTHETYCEDIYHLLPLIKTDMVYFDPPYGTMNKNLKVATRYASFYHLWNTLILNHQPELFGKAGKPTSTKGWTPNIEKNDTEIVKDEFKRLIRLCNSRYVSFSYSNQGLLTKQEFYDIFKECGIDDIDFYEESHQVNNQTNHAKKEGLFIKYGRERKALKEYLFVGKRW